MRILKISTFSVDNIVDKHPVGPQMARIDALLFAMPVSWAAHKVINNHRLDWPVLSAPKYSCGKFLQDCLSGDKSGPLYDSTSKVNCYTRLELL